MTDSGHLGILSTTGVATVRPPAGNSGTGSRFHRNAHLSRGHAWHPRFSLGATLTLAGTGSNAANWLAPGYVVDYLRIPLTGLAFNLADISALVGFALACSFAVSGRYTNRTRTTDNPNYGR
ncbi:MAG: signal peptidase II [Bacillota bacterium]|uniref:signal peptidase II n=1 Tax=Desulforudis sp. DRI-14 TaxID=3459793 RepID=UPI003469D306